MGTLLELPTLPLERFSLRWILRMEQIGRFTNIQRVAGLRQQSFNTLEAFQDLYAVQKA
ncbi:MAG: hypothetical protein ABUK20_10140 [Anaerolineales bacterium]